MWQVVEAWYRHEPAVYERLLDAQSRVLLPPAAAQLRARGGDRQGARKRFLRYVLVYSYLELFARLDFISVPVVMRSIGANGSDAWRRTTRNARHATKRCGSSHRRSCGQRRLRVCK